MNIYKWKQDIAIFDKLVNEEKKEKYINVGMGEEKIVDITEYLKSSGFSTCSGLSMIIGNKKFMAHIAPSTTEEKINKIVKDIQSEISKQNIDPKTLTVYTYEASLNPEFSFEKVKEICSRLKIPERNIVNNVVFPFSTITI